MVSDSTFGDNAWVGALQAHDVANWEICKEYGLWGTGSSAARSVRTGDDLFIWKSGSGWFARCIVTSDAFSPSSNQPEPWHDGRNYKWMFGIRVIKENDEPYQPGSTNNRQNITDIPNVRLSQFPRLKPEERQAVVSFFGLTNPPMDEQFEEIERMLDDEHEREMLQRSDLSPRDVEQVTMARRGQGTFRSSVERIEVSCRITGLRNKQHLRASHIKPWRDSVDFEKVDGHNGLLLSPHVDHLFDRGWIKFNDDGFFETSRRLDPDVLRSWRIEQPTSPTSFLPRQVEYLEYHREFIFGPKKLE